MAVYIDNARIPFRGMLMSHMIADTLDELHAMAAKIGLQRSWFQDGVRPHYDVALAKRAVALMFGAKSVTSRELVNILRLQREAAQRL